MNRLINRILLLAIALFFTIAGFILIEKTDLIQILLCILGVIISIFLLVDVIQEIRIIKHPSTKRNKMFIRTIIAICLIGLSSLFLVKVINNTIFMISNEKTTATITEVAMSIDLIYNYSANEYTRNTNKYTCSTKINYEVGNKEYETYLDTQKCIFKEKDKVTIYYKKNNPNIILSVPVILVPLFLSILSILVTIIYIITIRKIIKNEQE